MPVLPVGPAVWILIGRLLPILREVIRATRADSDGGRRVTPAERRRILDAALGEIGAALEGGLDDLDDLDDLDRAAARVGEEASGGASPGAVAPPRRPSRRRGPQSSE